MKIRNLLLLVVLFVTLLSLISCNLISGSVVNYEIINKSSAAIDKAVISFYAKSSAQTREALNIKPNEKSKISWDISGLLDCDGCYVITVYSGTNKREKIFGYISNGYPNYKNYSITVDSTQISVITK